MALRAMYKGFKKVLAPLIVNRPGELAIDQDALNAELDNVFFTRAEQLELGALNLLGTPYKTAPTTQNGVVYTYDSDGVITLSTPDGSATAQTDIVLFGVYGSTSEVIKVGDGNYTISTGNTKDGIETRIAYNTTLLGSGKDAYKIKAPNGISFVLLRIANGTVITTPITLKPMLVMGDVFVPFAPKVMTNKELTDEVETLNNKVLFKTLTSANDLNDISESGWFSWGSSAPANSPQSVQYACMKSIIETGVQKHIVFFGSDTIYMRQKSGSPAAWSSWYKFQGTIVS